LPGLHEIQSSGCARPALENFIYEVSTLGGELGGEFLHPIIAMQCGIAFSSNSTGDREIFRNESPDRLVLADSSRSN
jgi:hypothetical protein